MRKKRIIIQIPQNLKDKLDVLRNQGTTASGFIRHLLEREFNKATTERKGR